jgi:hypothetical protein
MRYALIGPENEWLAGPLDEEPVAGTGERVEIVALGYPETVSWSQELNGFVDIGPPALLSKLQFQRLFTQAERIAVRGSADPLIVDYRELGQLADGIDLTDPDVIAGVGYLEVSGLIGTGRAAEVLAGNPPA